MKQVRAAYDLPAPSEVGSHCTTRLENAHDTEVRELVYPWHPWSGLRICIHEVVERPDGIVFRCDLKASGTGRWLEIPAWMFDRAACPDTTLKSVPFVSFGALQALSTLLDQALRRRAASSNASFCAVSRVSRSENRREAHGREDGSEDRVDEVGHKDT